MYIYNMQETYVSNCIAAVHPLLPFRHLSAREGACELQDKREVPPWGGMMQVSESVSQ